MEQSGYLALAPLLWQAVLCLLPALLLVLGTACTTLSWHMAVLGQARRRGSAASAAEQDTLLLLRGSCNRTMKGQSIIHEGRKANGHEQCMNSQLWPAPSPIKCEVISTACLQWQPRAVQEQQAYQVDPQGTKV
jgi:hypothetical protein